MQTNPDRGPKIVAKSLCILLLFFLYSWFLIICLHARVLLSILNTRISRYGSSSYALLLLFNYNFCLILCDFHISKMLCFVLISVSPHFLNCYWYWFILNYISMWIIPSTNHSIYKHQAESMKTNTSCMKARYLSWIILIFPTTTKQKTDCALHYND